jgi:DNA-binding NarL/FixJ family response regulator
MTSSRQEKSLDCLRILVVDDDAHVRRALGSLLLSRRNWQVCGEAADGLDAIEKAKALRPDIILMDVSMPRMNGLDATRVIRRDLPESNIVIISQNDPAVVSRQARYVDAAACIAKVDLSRDLLSTISRVAGAHNSETMPSGSLAAKTDVPTMEFANTSDIAPSAGVSPGRGSSFKVRGTEILATDTPRQYLQKLARIAIDEMYQFVAVLDAKGTRRCWRRLHPSKVREDITSPMAGSRIGRDHSDLPRCRSCSSMSARSTPACSSSIAAVCRSTCGEIRFCNNEGQFFRDTAAYLVADRCSPAAIVALAPL